MKPIVTASQIAAQAYAQGTVQPKPRMPVGQMRFVVDVQKPAEDVPNSFRRIRRETDSFKIEISAEALAASERDQARRRSALPREEIIEASDDVGQVSFQAVEAVGSGAGRREAPFAHDKGAVTVSDVPRRPGSLVDITI